MTRHSGRTLNVLIVEDNAEIAELQALALRSHVDSVQLVTDLFARCFQPDTWQGVTCAVLDLMLPGFEGEDVARYLRDDFPLIRRVICTAKPMHELVDLARLADGILQKPFLIDDLIRMVTTDDG